MVKPYKTLLTYWQQVQYLPANIAFPLGMLSVGDSITHVNDILQEHLQHSIWVSKLLIHLTPPRQARHLINIC